MRAVRIVLVSAVAIAAMGIAAASASAVVVSDQVGTCPSISGGPAGSGTDFTGGCAFTANSPHSTLESDTETLDCDVTVVGVVGGDGSVGINEATFADANSTTCNELVEVCLDDVTFEPILPWPGIVSGADPDFLADINFCVDTPLGRAGTADLSAATRGSLANGNPPTMTFTDAAVGGNPDLTLTAVYSIVAASNGPLVVSDS